MTSAKPQEQLRPSGLPKAIDIKGKGKAADRFLLPHRTSESLLETWQAQQAAKRVAALARKNSKEAATPAYFSANRPSSPEPVASTSKLTPSSSDFDFSKHPRTLGEVQQFVQEAFAAGREDVLETFLESSTCHDDQEMLSVALLAILALPVQAPYHAHIARLNRRTRRAILKDQGHAAGRGLSPSFFAKSWQQAWEVLGPNEPLASVLAQKILRNIMEMQREEPLRGEAFGVPAMRHLLFSADITQNAILGLDMLAHTVVPHAFALLPHLVETNRLPQTATVEEIVLVFQDFLRAGIIQPAVLRDFDFSSVINKSLELSPDNFIQLLQQVTLRVLAQCYHSRHVHDRALLMLRYLEVIEGDTELDNEKDGNLAANICHSALRASEHDGRWVNRVANIVVMAVNGKLPYWKPQYVPANLVQLLYTAALPIKRKQYPSIRSKYTSAALVWKASQAAEAAGLHWPSPTIGQLVQIVGAFSRPMKATSLADTQRHFDEYEDSVKARLDDFVESAAVLIERLQSGMREALSNLEANRLLYVFLTCRVEFAESEEAAKVIAAREGAILDLVLGLYQLVSGTTPLLSDRFVLSSASLVPLVKCMMQAGDAAAAKSAVQDFLRDRRDLHGPLSPLELTTAARAFFIAGERSAGLAVFTQMLTQHSVPDLVDTRILLQDVAQSDPTAVVELIREMTYVGFKLDFETAKFLFGPIAECSREAAKLFLRFVRDQEARPASDKARIVNMMQVKLDTMAIAGIRYKLLTAAEELEKHLGQGEKSPTSATASMKEKASNTLRGLIQQRAYAAVRKLLHSAGPQKLVDEGVLLDFLDAQPSRLNSGSRRRLRKTQRGHILSSLLDFARDRPEVLQEHLPNQNMRAYNQARRLAFLFDSQVSTQKLENLVKRSRNGQLQLQEDDLAGFASMLRGRTREEKGKWLSEDEISRLPKSP